MTKQSESLTVKPWAIVLKLEIKEECVDEFLQLVQGVIDNMRHEKTFISTSLCVDPGAPNKFLIYEVWQDREELATVQMTREYRRPLMSRVPSLTKSPAVFEGWHELRADYAVHVRR